MRVAAGGAHEEFRGVNLMTAGSPCSRRLGLLRQLNAASGRVPDILDTVRLALGLLLRCSMTTLLHVIALSLAVSLSASRRRPPSAGLPLGTGLPGLASGVAVRWILQGERAAGVTTGVVVGLALYICCCRARGRSALLGFCFTPTAMVVAQFLLAVLIVARRSVIALMEGGLAGITEMTCWSPAQAASGPFLISWSIGLAGGPDGQPSRGSDGQFPRWEPS